MGYIEENMSSQEEIIYQTNLSKIVFITPFLISSCSLIVGYVFVDKPLILSMGILFAILPLLKAWTKYISSEFGVTDRRVIIKTGFFSTQSLEIQLSKIESIMVFQNLSEKIINCGTIVLSGTGGTKDAFQRIAYPFEFKKMIENQMDFLS
jgi:uncharacterized membrane protein YdbT with pleckstrin-like domain